MATGIVVGFKDVKRKADGGVTGEVTLVWREDAFGKEVQLLSIGDKFDIPKNGEKVIFDTPIDVGIIKVSGSAKVFEKKDADQVCVQGRVEAKAVGFEAGKDLDENCHPIPAA